MMRPGSTLWVCTGGGRRRSSKHTKCFTARFSESGNDAHRWWNSSCHVGRSCCCRNVESGRLYSGQVVAHPGEVRRRVEITHGHNTVVDPNAQPFDPVNSGWNG